MGLFFVCRAYLKQKAATTDKTKEDEAVLTEHKFFSFTGTYWGVHSVAVSMTFIIDIVYWTLLHSYNGKEGEKLFYYMDEHAANFVFMMGDWFIVAFPMIVMNFLHLFIIAAMYNIVSVIYYLAGGLDMFFFHSYLYPFLDWNSPSTTIVNVTSVIVFNMLIMLMLMMLDILKHKIFRRRRSENVEPQTNNQQRDRTPSSSPKP
ncbi:hypothetical protein GE061_007806 [Apolygus lucorum]|uniref:Uncharacterized protein n=1 Tax=Apolygus lucorum TaxID=248454 RepID=A0A8S9WLR6_APOLU|nr:hypothetical protein GE061_007806 [Apolygus lucorum]